MSLGQITTRIVTALKASIRPLRLALGRFAIVCVEDDSDTLFWKAGKLVAADKIEGDYLEFGVYTGNSFCKAYRVIGKAFAHASTPNEWNAEEDCRERRAIWDRMRFFAFDSFEGLPEVKGIDAESRDFRAGKYARSEEAFRAGIAARGVPLSRVTTVAGWFDQSLTDEARRQYGLTAAAIIHIDVDLYESARSVMGFVTPLLQDGTVIIFDDWYSFKANPARGEQRAFGEWLRAHPEWVATQFHKEGVWRNSFVMNRAENGSGGSRAI